MRACCWVAVSPVALTTAAAVLNPLLGQEIRRSVTDGGKKPKKTRGLRENEGQSGSLRLVIPFDQNVSTFRARPQLPQHTQIA
jgi:hypothetical protein